MFDGKGASNSESNAAVELVDDLYHSLLRDTLESSNNLWKVQKHLAELKRNDPCFDYRIARDEITGAPTCVVWQTGTNRADFELYGCQIHLDFMMRKMNSYLWPYISVVVVDANGSPRCALEGIACTERVGAYVFAVKVVSEMTPGRKSVDVKVVFADGRLDASILKPGQMDLSNAQLFWDQYHLLRLKL